MDDYRSKVIEKNWKYFKRTVKKLIDRKSLQTEKIYSTIETDLNRMLLNKAIALSEETADPWIQEK